MRLGEMWKHAKPLKEVRVVEATVIKTTVTRTTISPMCCDECDGTPSDRCWEQYNCLVAFDRKFDRPTVGRG